MNPITERTIENDSYEIELQKTFENRDSSI